MSDFIIVPFADMLTLNAAEAMINQTFFEGWATSVGEAKCLGTPLILSDLPVCREQAPHAAFFNPNNAAALARCLEHSAAAPPPQPAPTAQLHQVNATRRADFALSFLSATQSAFTLAESVWH